jgi:hypothetical protein
VLTSQRAFFTQLNDELQQLGLPRENADGISRPYRSNAAALHVAAAARTLALPRLTSLQWRVDVLLSSSALPQAGTTVAHLQLGTSHDSAQAQPKPTADELGVQVRLAAGRAGDSNTPNLTQGTHDAELSARMDTASRALGVGAAALNSRGATLQVSLTQDKLLALLSELRAAKELMDQTHSTLTTA